METDEQLLRWRFKPVQNCNASKKKKICCTTFTDWYHDLERTAHGRHLRFVPFANLLAILYLPTIRYFGQQAYHVHSNLLIKKHLLSSFRQSPLCSEPNLLYPGPCLPSHACLC
ncbi:hypothetical protein CEXT_742551 [Caerostris extrusa]|uniref:Uncharacterized protein n=1 Tax=Caerostris extrusa TaxID=172846 RepID=A0AAV4RSA3_CAEEX|nr:hypothetical protein CEXT_742551 [Caerostris extrusa]